MRSGGWRWRRGIDLSRAWSRPNHLLRGKMDVIVYGRWLRGRIGIDFRVMLPAASRGVSGLASLKSLFKQINANEELALAA